MRLWIVALAAGILAIPALAQDPAGAPAQQSEAAAPAGPPPAAAATEESAPEDASGGDE